MLCVWRWWCQRTFGGCFLVGVLDLWLVGVLHGGVFLVRVCRTPPGTVWFPGVCCESVFGGVLLSHTLSGAVPSALEGLASGFGMGPGVSPPLWPP